MKSIKLIAFFLLTAFSLIAQQKITVEEIYTGAFRAKAMDELQSLKSCHIN